MGLSLDVLRIVLIAGCYFFMLAFTILFLRCFYDPGFQWSHKKAFFLLLHSLVYGITYVFPSTLASFLWIPEILIVIYDYRGKILRGVFRYMWVMLIIFHSTFAVSEIGRVYIFPIERIHFNEVNSILDMAVSILQCIIFGLVFFYLYFYVYKKDIFLRFEKREKVFATTYAILSLTLTVIIHAYGKKSDEILVVLGITFVFTAVLLPIFFYYLQISKYYQQRAKFQEQHILAELAHFQQYQQMQEKTSRFRHDIRNNFLCLNDMLQQGKTNEAVEYLKDLMGTVDKLSPKYVTGDALLDSIISVKMQTIEEHGIRFELDGVLAGGLPWKPMDICNVFANALDNAIEACQKVIPERRSIAITIRSSSQFWFVTIENSVFKKVDTSKLFQKNGGYTSKTDSSQHGIGTYNMKCTVESYGAMIKAECTEESFKLEIMIDKSNPE